MAQPAGFGFWVLDNVFVCHWMYLFVYLLVCVLCICFRASWSLCREDAAAVLGAKEEWGQRPARQHPPAGAQSREIRKKNFRFFCNFDAFFNGLKSDPCLAGSVSQSVGFLRLDLYSCISPSMYFCSLFAFLSNGDEERGAAAKLAKMIDKTDHEDEKKEIFCVEETAFGLLGNCTHPVSVSLINF